MVAARSPDVLPGVFADTVAAFFANLRLVIPTVGLPQVKIPVRQRREAQISFGVDAERDPDSITRGVRALAAQCHLKIQGQIEIGEAIPWTEKSMRAPQVVIASDVGHAGTAAGLGSATQNGEDDSSFLLWNAALTGLASGRHARRDGWDVPDSDSETETETNSEAEADANVQAFIHLEKGRYDFHNNPPAPASGAGPVRVRHIAGLIATLFIQGDTLVLPQLWHQVGDVQTAWQPECKDLLAHDWRFLDA